MKQGKPFQVLIYNFGEYATDLLPHQVVAYTSQHPEPMGESYLPHTKMFGQIPDNVHAECRKGHVGTIHVATIIKNVADKREKHM